MIRYLLVLVLATACLAAAPPGTVIIFGDSITAGGALPKEQREDKLRELGASFAQPCIQTALEMRPSPRRCRLKFWRSAVCLSPLFDQHFTHQPRHSR